MEIWKPVTTFGLEKYYEVSNLGNVRSLERTGQTNYGKRFYGGKSINPFFFFIYWDNFSCDVYLKKIEK